MTLILTPSGRVVKPKKINFQFYVKISSVILKLFSISNLFWKDAIIVFIMVLKRSAKKFPWTPQKKRNVWTLKIVIIYSQFSLILPRGVLTTLHLASHDTPCQYTRSYYYLNVMHTRCIQLGILTLKGLFTNFEYIKNFSCPTERNIFYEKVHLDKTTLTRNNWENRVHKVSPTEYYHIYYSYNTY